MHKIKIFFCVSEIREFFEFIDFLEISEKKSGILISGPYLTV
jgi:hypothetical protein